MGAKLGKTFSHKVVGYVTRNKKIPHGEGNYTPTQRYGAHLELPRSQVTLRSLGKRHFRHFLVDPEGGEPKGVGESLSSM